MQRVALSLKVIELICHLDDFTQSQQDRIQLLFVTYIDSLDFVCSITKYLLIKQLHNASNIAF